LTLKHNNLQRRDKTIRKSNQKSTKEKLDAIICWDTAVIKLCNKYKIPFFVSTQASISNIEAAKFYKSLGAKRIILAREFKLKTNKRNFKNN